MKYAVLFNRLVFVLQALVCILVYGGTLNFEDDDLGILIFLTAPVFILAQLITSITIDIRKRGINYLGDNMACGIVFLIPALFILIRGII